MIRNCIKHGDTEHSIRTDKGHRCKKCQVETTQKRRDKLKQMSIDYKGGSCSMCGYSKCVAALEFHHLDPTQKEFGIGANGHTKAWDKIKDELDKCILVCANCHREIHYGSEA